MKLTIITINYNNREGLKKTIDSVICQTWRDFEWIVIDGGSTDGSKELIEQYQEHFAYWCSEPDKGVYNAMNKGIAKANGDYLNFMNSGDCFASPTILEEIFITPYTADILYGYMLAGSINGNTCNKRLMKNKIEWYDLYYDTLPHQSTFIRKDLIRRLGGYREDLKIVADWELFVKAIVYEKSTYKFISKKISIYEGNGISSSSELRKNERLAIIHQLFPKMMVDELPSIISIKTVRNYRLTRPLYSLLYRIACHRR